MKVSKTIGQLDFPDSYSLMLGKIVMSWGWLEYRVHEAVWHLLGLPRKAGRSATNQMDIRVLTKTLRDLARVRIKDTTLSHDVADLAKALTEKCSTRNNIVHGIWEWDAQNNLATVRIYRDHAKGGHVSKYNLTKLANVLSGIRQDAARLQSLLDRV